MRIIINGKNSHTLRQTIVSDSLSEKLPTWGVVNNIKGEQLLTHTPAQWNERVLLVITEVNDHVLAVTASYWKNHEVPSLDDISYYFGRFIEILLIHYREQINRIEIEL